MPSTLRRGLARAATAVAAGMLTAFTAAGPAAAHVTIATPSAVAGSYTLLTVSVPHGCDGEATTEIAIQIPEPINAITPSINPNWEVEMVMADLSEPVVDSHGNEITERVDQVVYTAHEPLPDGLRDAFELSLRVPEEAAGQTLYFPIVQTCTSSEHPWIEVPAEGQDPDELASPAPSITVTAPDDADAAETVTEDETEDEDTEAAADDESPDTLTYIALAAAVIGIGLAAFALLRGRRSA